MNLIQLEDAKNLHTDNMICKGPDGKDIWKVQANLQDTHELEIKRTIVTDQPVNMIRKMSYQELSSGSWYVLDASEFDRLSESGLQPKFHP